MKYWISLLALAFLLYNFTCSKTLQSRFITLDTVTKIDGPRPGLGDWENACCRDYLHYAPDTNYLDLTPMRTIRVNFHFMNAADSTQNFNEKEGVAEVKELMKACHYWINNNKKMNLPIGNDTPVLPTRYQYELTPDPSIPGDDGIYFHYDDEFYPYVVRGKDRNHFKKEVIKKYGVQKDSVLNIFIQPHHPDSIASKTYKGRPCGIALGKSVKLAGWKELDKTAWRMSIILNHEIGHVYSLSHTWAYNDGCEDTPKNPKCWNYTDNGTACDSLASNNLMDYNVYQNAWSPCQIGKVRRSMSGPRATKRSLVKNTWCEVAEEQFVTITDSLHLAGTRDLEHSLIIEDGGILKVSCRVSIPKDGRIIVKPGGKLILDNATLHNACSYLWEGVEVQTKGRKKGEVVFIGSPKIRNIKHPLL